MLCLRSGIVASSSENTCIVVMQGVKGFYEFNPRKMRREDEYHEVQVLSAIEQLKRDADWLEFKMKEAQYLGNQREEDKYFEQLEIKHTEIEKERRISI